MKTPEELFAALGNRGEYAALPHVTLDEVRAIHAEGYASWWDNDLVANFSVQRAVINKLRVAINEAIAISGTGTPQDWTDAQVGLCRVLEEVKVMLGEES